MDELMERKIKGLEEHVEKQRSLINECLKLVAIQKKTIKIMDDTMAKILDHHQILMKSELERMDEVIKNMKTGEEKPNV